MPSQVEHTMETRIFMFHKLTGDKGGVAKKDLKVVMGKEFPGFLENHEDPLATDEIMKDLDQCQDGRVGFQNFSLIAGLPIACNAFFVVHMDWKGKK